MQPYNSPILINKELNYKSLYSEVLAEKELLLEEMKEYRNLQISIDENNLQCQETYAECERFAKVLLHHYQKSKQSETEGKERKRRWNCERDQLKHLIGSLSVQIQEKDYNIESLKTQNEVCGIQN